MKFDQSILQGNHVNVEPIHTDHLDGLNSAATNPNIWKFIPFALNDSSMMERFVTHVASLPEKGEGQAYAIRHINTNKIIGGSGYWHIDQQHSKLEIGGSWLMQEFQHSGANTEIKYLLLKNAFEVLGCIRVAFSIDVRNKNSLKAIERIGATQEGVSRCDMKMHDGTIRDSAIYSIVKDEWLDVKLYIEQLQAKYA